MFPVTGDLRRLLQRQEKEEGKAALMERAGRRGGKVNFRSGKYQKDVIEKDARR